jgi:hypothetical protein
MPSPIYPWDSWFARESFRLVRGRDYDCPVSSIIQQVRNAASRRGLGVSVSEGKDGTLRVTVHREAATNGAGR